MPTPAHQSPRSIRRTRYEAVRRLPRASRCCRANPTQRLRRICDGGSNAEEGASSRRGGTRPDVRRPHAIVGLGASRVDDFFSPLADVPASNAIAVVLSGSGSDGAKGIEGIKEHGGITPSTRGKDADGNGVCSIHTGYRTESRCVHASPDGPLRVGRNQLPNDSPP